MAGTHAQVCIRLLMHTHGNDARADSESAEGWAYILGSLPIAPCSSSQRRIRRNLELCGGEGRAPTDSAWGEK